MSSSFEIAVVENNLEFAQFVLTQLQHSTTTLFSYLNLVCQYGRQSLLPLFPSPPTINWDQALGHACINNQTHMLADIVRKGTFNWDYALITACQMGRLDIVQVLVERLTFDGCILEQGYLSSAKHNQLQILIFFHKTGMTLSWPHILRLAFSSPTPNMLPLIRWVLQHYQPVHWDDYLVYAMNSNDLTKNRLVFENVISQYNARSKRFNLMWFNLAMQQACRNNNRELIDYFIEKMTDQNMNYWDIGLQGACNGGHEKTAHEMIAKGAVIHHQTLKSVRNNFSLFQYILSELQRRKKIAPDDFETLSSVILHLICSSEPWNSENLKIFHQLIKMGASLSVVGVILFDDDLINTIDLNQLTSKMGVEQCLKFNNIKKQRQQTQQVISSCLVKGHVLTKEVLAQVIQPFVSYVALIM